jgi:hypothetical protein
MGNVDLDIELDSELVAQIRDLALRYFGDESEESLGRVLALAFRIRCLWSHSILKGYSETDEPVTTWEFSESNDADKSSDSVTDWLFRR